MSKLKLVAMLTVVFGLAACSKHPPSNQISPSTDDETSTNTSTSHNLDSSGAKK
ncbi:MAG: hypothetical protein ACXWQO_16650 [Bdellovibrionota bacterium]